MIVARILCAFGAHQWVTTKDTVKEPVASQDGVMLCRVTIKEQKDCLACGVTGDKSTIERIEVYENEIEDDEEWGA